MGMRRGPNAFCGLCGEGALEYGFGRDAAGEVMGEKVRSTSGIIKLSESGGFTLLELLLATLISSLVIGILSVALSFSLRMWERQRSGESPEMPRILDLMKWQLATFDPVPINSEGESQALFLADNHSLTFSTDYSLRGISRGAPVVARYVYVPEEKKLYYAEMPLDPYHPDPIMDFSKMTAGPEESWPQFYSVEVADFSLSFAAEPDESFGESWESDQLASEDANLPGAVLVTWTLKEGEPASSSLIIPNFLFPITGETSGVTGQTDPSSPSRSPGLDEGGTSNGSSATGQPAEAAE